MWRGGGRRHVDVAIVVVLFHTRRVPRGTAASAASLTIAIVVAVVLLLLLLRRRRCRLRMRRLLWRLLSVGRLLLVSRGHALLIGLLLGKAAVAALITLPVIGRASTAGSSARFEILRVASAASTGWLVLRLTEECSIVWKGYLLECVGPSGVRPVGLKQTPGALLV